MTYGMVIDLKRCIGCRGCEIFCKNANATAPGVLWSRVLFYELGTYPAVKKVPVPVLCMHCRKPACVDVCPTGASIKRSDGIVTIEESKCTGCLNCLMACAYGARHLSPGKDEGHFPGQGLTPYEKIGSEQHPRGAVGKCNFCLQRIERGLKPACVQSCMSKARFFGDLDDPESEVSQLVRKGGAFQIRPVICSGDRATGETSAMDTVVYYLER